MPKVFFSLIFTLPRVEVIYLYGENKMKSIALTLAVLFGLVSVAQATTETPATTDQPSDAAIQSASGEGEGSPAGSTPAEETEQNNN